MSTPAVGVLIQGDNQAGPAIVEVQAQLDSLGASAQAMADKMSAAAGQTKFSMMEAKGTLALVGEEIGVSIPRHVRTFIAELPGVGVALEAAFSATALFVLLDVVVRVAEKVGEWYDKLTMASATQKENEKEAQDLTKALDEQAKKLGELQQAFETVGLSGLALTKEKMAELQVQIQALEKELESYQETLFANARGIGSFLDSPLTQAAVDMMNSRSLVIQATLKTMYQQSANLNKQTQKEEESAAQASLARKIAAGNAELDAQKTLGKAELELAISNANLLYAQGAIDETEQIAQI